MKSPDFKPTILNLSDRLSSSGIEKSNLDKYKYLIENTKFLNIDINHESNLIHLDMIAALFSEQENGEIFLENILQKISRGWIQVEDILVTSTKEIYSESIDLDIGTNRRVDKIECHFNDGKIYLFTLSADFENHKDINESNSFVEKEVFESPLSQNNPWLQNYFGYSDNKLLVRPHRMIAKEFLPGKNISQYCNELDSGETMTDSFIDVTCETGYSIGGLYKKMDGQLLSDLKLENIIYNKEDSDGEKPACRICDHSGFYESDADLKSVYQILANIHSLMTIYYVKSSYLGTSDDANLQRNEAAVSIITSYLDSFISEIGNDLNKKFIKQIKIIKNEKVENRQFSIPDDLVDFTLDYIN